MPSRPFTQEHLMISGPLPWLLALVLGGASPDTTPGDPLTNTHIQSQSDTTLMMVQTVAPGSRTLRGITGISLALRSYEFEVPAQCPITLGGNDAELADVRRGTVVRIVYRTAGSRMIADRIVGMRMPGGDR